MIAKVYSTIPYGYDGRLITVEGDSSRGLPAFNIVGMANKTVSEARERVRSALHSSDLNFPAKRLTINLAPAELAKDGSFLDLPIALSILVLSHQLRQSDLDNIAFVGELSLTGALRPVRGIINIVEAARTAGFHTVYLPQANLTQATLVPDIALVGNSTLNDVVLHLKHQLPLTPPPHVKITKTPVSTPTLDHICGQDFAKRALAIAIAGHHNLLLNGPPGAGKTLLARAATSLLPPLSAAEQIQITKLHALNSISEDPIVTRPFRAPHHTCTITSLIGGGSHILPGEISLAHLGVLFLDELPEFPRPTLEALRQPLEDRQVTISRAHQKITYPADFMLIATMNPCPCGYLGHPTHNCTCTQADIARYRRKLSGPLLDRIDLRVNVKPLPTSDLLTVSSLKLHDNVKNTITEAITRQHHRYHNTTAYNAHLTATQASQLPISPPARRLLASAAEQLSLSARAYFKIIKVAQTIADLASEDCISEAALSEALSYR